MFSQFCRCYVYYSHRIFLLVNKYNYTMSYRIVLTLIPWHMSHRPEQSLRWFHPAASPAKRPQDRCCCRGYPADDGGGGSDASARPVGPEPCHQRHQGDAGRKGALDQVSWDRNRNDYHKSGKVRIDNLSWFSFLLSSFIYNWKMFFHTYMI